MLSRALITVAVLAGMSVESSTNAQTVGTAITYQGRLTDGGSPVTGAHDLQFRLYAASSGGSPLGPTLCVEDLIPAADGTFTASLDFGSQFDGNARFLEISVRADTGTLCSNAAGYTTLLPRQELTAAPNALWAANTGNATTLGGNSVSFFTNASNMSSGTLSLARGGTGVNLSATGGSGRVLRQDSPGGPVTVGPITMSDLPIITGDVVGQVGGTTTVVRIGGQFLSLGSPAAGDSLMWTGSAWSPSSPVMNGDVLGNTNNATVIRIHGRPIAGFAPNVGDVYFWNGSWLPGQITLAGDVVGLHGSNSVARIQGRNVASTAPTADQVLVYSGVNSRWEPRTFTTASMPHTHAPTDLTSPVPITLGGTGQTTTTAALSALGAPGLTLANSFTGVNSFSNATSFFNTASISVASTSAVALTVNNPTGTTADIQRWNVNAGTLARITSSGGFTTSGSITSGGSISATGSIAAGTSVSAQAYNLSISATRYVEVPCHAFRPLTSAPTFSWSTSGTTSLSAAGTTLAQFVAPLYLPHNAVVTEIRFRIYDNDPTFDMSCAIYSYADGFTDNTVPGGSGFSTGTLVSVRDVVLTPTYTADAASQSQYLVASWNAAAGTNIRLFRVRVSYTVTTPLP